VGGGGGGQRRRSGLGRLRFDGGVTTLCSVSVDAGLASKPVVVRGVTRRFRRSLSRRERGRAAREGRGGTPAVRTALDGCSLEVVAGETVALLGPNGSGKSTLVRLLLGQDRADEGELLVFGEPAERGAALRRGLVGAAFQEPGLDHLLTVRENLTLHGRLYGLGADESDARIDRLTRRLGVASHLHDRVSALSGGLRRRADIARALLTEPRLLVLDEPASGLDIAGRAEVAGLLRERAGVAAEAAVVVTTHHAEIAAAATRIVMLNGGRVAADGTVDELRSRLTGISSGGVDGEMMLRSAGDAAETALAGVEGVTVRRDASGETVASGDRSSLARAAAVLAEAGIGFELELVSIERLYHALAGGDLERVRGVGLGSESR